MSNIKSKCKCLNNAVIHWSLNIINFQWGVELDEENEIQINMSGVAIGFVDRDKKVDVKKKDSSSG